MADQFGDRENILFASGDHHAATDFAAFDELFHQYLVALLERFGNSREQFILFLDLGDTETAAARIRFDKQRQAQFRDDGCGVYFRSFVQQNLFGQVDAAAGDGPFAGSFVERQHRGYESAGRIRNAHHVEIALQPAVFAGGAVNDDQGIVEFDFPAGDGQGKVVAVEFAFCSVRRCVGPVPVAQDNGVRGVTAAVEGASDIFGALQRDLPFRGVPSGQQGYVSYHGNRCYVRVQK